MMNSITTNYGTNILITPTNYLTTQSGPGFGDKPGARICLRLRTSYNTAA